ncbi:MAG: M23 family metallopeptidase [Planctomycetota bacterium]|jgi:murein DD-endopeptidase MepM/ murein hydrolase activator NlpD
MSGVPIRRSRAAWLLALALGCTSTPAPRPAPAPPGDPPGPEQVAALGQELTARLYARDAEALDARLSEEMRDLLRDVPAFVESINEQLGGEVELLGERVVPWLGGGVYSRRSRFSEQAMPIDVTWTMDGAGTVVGLHYQPAPSEAPGPYEDYRTRSNLRLPFEDRWYVFWGGRSAVENYHVVARDQRYAYDLVVVADGSTHRGDGTANEQYYAFGRPIVAPADGRVVNTANDVPDNRPGLMNAIQPLGNHVIIDHGNGEFSFLAHFQQFSVLVRPGQEVRKGQVLARCGNSGNSSEPHLHYHLQDSPRFGQGDGLPAQFQGYELNGEKVWRGEPTRGQAVEHFGEVRNIHEPVENPEPQPTEEPKDEP